ncbi:MAG: MGMT family protein [Candidatus Woesearchaeota archaeon]|nr:MAG: MGMT family protein [Candidatus Woesearchaeota archaeon]
MHRSFSQNVLELTARVPKGMVTTYADIARALGTGAYRAVGRALQTNPSTKTYPCHRVVKSTGELGGYFGETSGPAILAKKSLLEKEGVQVTDNRIVNFAEKHFRFSKPRFYK